MRSLTASPHGCPLTGKKLHSGVRKLSDDLLLLLDRMAASGATAFYAKRLAPNDNSKNQIYLGGGFEALNTIPHGPIETDSSSKAGSVRDRAKAPVRFFWLDAEGLSPAPDVQLILYPKYPEVRISGFLKGAERSPSDLMRSRDPGRVLFLGACPDGRVLGAAAGWSDPAVSALDAAEPLETTGVFLNLTGLRTGVPDTRTALINRLREIHLEGWIASKKLGSHGPQPYQAQNGGGYTLEAELGITPNGNADPDYLGWEIKQYGVRDFVRFAPKSVVTLMTPEPTSGYYRDAGPEAFVRRFGYPDQSGKVGRINFGGAYAIGKEANGLTGLNLTLSGYDATTGKITDMDGGIHLIDVEGTRAATWAFEGLISHWNRKHARACYVPSIRQGPPFEYMYGGRIEMCEGTDFFLFLRAVSDGVVFYDPALKLEGATSAKPALKRRNQFRVRHQALAGLYRNAEREML
ncbi:MvaI/BcnI family restriction endonuclease [Aliiroseovarius subalbicans]|uniref:MvaI/BcnI family restriction endonuclease n=1 Tax=Aliiroseovarius subalbicans TaxID=2925840 RepID=UPI001F58F38A|nr:MvaI/BcnI family restriction endonuclease [Aliiroseovarius subalbicans]MCI2400815.1 MvaI/BcnI restriction endonuclease family protein [Aliiroseovarius subalbicans]